MGLNELFIVHVHGVLYAGLEEKEVALGGMVT